MPTSRRPAAAPAGRNSIRIVAGQWRGRRISFPDLPGLRPTPDRVRETLFNWLQHDVAAARCLDLFAGSGALGIEALSRGAREVVFVEREAAAAAQLRAELDRLGGADRGRVLHEGARRFLATPGAPFDIAFLDPPFGQGLLASTLPLLASSGLVVPGGLVYVEAERSAHAPPLPPGWELLKSKAAGEVGYHLARVVSSPP